MMKQSVAVWLRHDLRLEDNPAFEAALATKETVHTLYALTTKTFENHHWAAGKLKFVQQQLEILKKHLHQHSIELTILELDTFKDIPTAFERFFKKHAVHTLFVNRHYAIDERECVIHLQKNSDVKLIETEGQWLTSPDQILTQQNTPFHVFTAFKRKAVGYLKNHFTPTALGEGPATRQLIQFCRHSLHDYHINRDIPSIQGTSQLSAYLAQGVLSPRQCLTAMLEATGSRTLQQLLCQPGPEMWLNELLWRDFYQHLMWHYPNLCKGLPFLAHTRHLRGSSNKNHFKAWCNGQTGFPFVDAGMRQLNQTGWMHNRLRMVTAMFLTKILFIDWHWGEQYFMEHLIDGDFAANNGGWQWCASTGTDAAPYFRIFNPITQGQRFDPQGSFIRHYCPELSSLSNKDIHCPNDDQRKQLKYPTPIIDYAQARLSVIEAFKSIRTTR